METQIDLATLTKEVNDLESGKSQFWSTELKRNFIRNMTNHAQRLLDKPLEARLLVLKAAMPPVQLKQ